MIIKNREDAIKHTADILNEHYHGEMTEEKAKVQLFGLGVYAKLLKLRNETAKMTGKSLEELEAEVSKPDKKMFLKKIN